MCSTHLVYLRHDGITVHCKNMNVYLFPAKKSQRTRCHHRESGMGRYFSCYKAPYLQSNILHFLKITPAEN